MRRFFCLVFALLPTLSLFGAEPENAVRPVVRALAEQQYKQAIELARAARAATPKDAGELLYLQALALHFQKKHAESDALVDQITSNFPASTWRGKAMALKARNRLAERDFVAARTILQAEAERLFAPKRKLGLARILTDFAAELAKKPAPDDYLAPKPDLSAAQALYKQAAEFATDPAVKEDIAFRRAKCLRHSAREQAWEEYLHAFDPDWNSDLTAHTPASVRHLCEARLSLAENMLKERRVGNARNTLFRLRDFAKTKALKNEILRGDIDYAVCRSYLLDGSNADAKTLAKPEVERFLRAFPAHPSAVHAAFELAKLERTPIAWQAFLDRKTYQLPTGVAAKTHHRGAKESPEKAEEELRAEAQFLLGAALLADGQFDAALQAWRVYEIRYPRGPRWKQTHQRTSDAQYARVLDPLRKKNWLKAEKSAELFLQENPMDKRAQRLLFVLGMIPLEKAGDEPDAASVEEALRRWERLRRKFPKSSESYVALVRGGRLCEDILQDPQRAAAYRQRGSYGRSGTNAHKLEQHLYKIELQARTERVFSCAETAKIVLETRNIERVSIRVHNIDLPAFFRTGGGFYGLAELDVELIAPDKQWDLDIPSYRKFLRQKTEIEIPFDATKPGVCMVVVEAGDTRAKTIVVRSNLELTMHVTRQSALAFVRDTTTNKGVPGTEVTVSHGEQFISAKTAEDGVCRLRFEKSGKPETLLPALATRDGHVAFTDAEIAKLNSTKTRRQYAYLYTDRHAVRPGETVGVRAILRDIVDGAYVLPKEKQWRIQLLSPGSAGLVAEHTVTLSEFGTVHTEFAIPAAAATGHYWVQILPIVRDGEHADSRRQRVLAKYRFKVATFELESSRLTFEFDRKAFFRGETIRGSVTAQRAWGAPIVGQTLGLTFPDGRSRRLTTDATGRITFEFSTAGRVAGETLTFSADIVGEDVSVSRTIALATKGFTIDLELPPQTVFAGEPFECKVTTRAPDGTPISREVSIQLQRRVPTSDIMIVAQASSDLSEGRPVQVETVRVTTDAKTGVGTVTLTPKAGGTHRVEASGKDRHGVRVEDAGEIDVSGDDDNVRLRILADGKPLKAGAKAAPRVHSRLPDGTLALVVWERGDILRHEVRELRKGKHPLEFDVEQRMYPKFKLVCLASAEGKLHSAENTFGVIRELRIEIEPAEPSHRPGTETTLRLRVTDQLGDPVRAELALALVNEMLFDAFPHPRLFPELGFRNALGKISESDSGSWGSADFSWSGGELESAEHLEPARLFRCSQTRASADDIDFGDDDDDDDDFGGDPFGGVPGGMMRANARRQGGLGGQTAIGREPRLDALLANAPTPREDLRTAHVWLPTIVTDEQGRGEVRFKLPGALAKWRTTLLGCTRETHVGATTVTIVTRKPLVAELRTPPFLREGDTVRFPVRIEAPGQTGQATLALKLVGENGSVTLAATATLANGVATVLFEPFTAKVPGDLRAELHVQLGALRDDVSRTIQILPWGIRMQATAGALTSSEAKTTLSLPQDTHFTTLAMSIALAPDTPESLLEGALDNTPAPLVEARTPSADLADVATELFGLCSLIEFSTDMRLDSPVTERVRARCSALLSELLVTQAKDGGWPCFAAGTSRLNVTLACVRALAAAQRVEMAVPEKVFAKARSVLLIKYEKLPAGQHRVQAAVLSALAERSKLGMTSPDVDLPRLTPLHRVRKTLDALGTAYAALACLDAGRKDLADGFLDRLLDQSELLGAPNDGQRIWTKGRNGQSARGLTALAAYALARAERYEEAEQALAALRREAGAAFLAPGAARGFSLAAAGLLCRRRASGIPASGRVRVEVNGHVLPGPRLGVSGAPRHVRIPRDWLKPIGNTIILTHPGNARFRYGATLVGFSPNIPAAAAGSATPTVRQRTIIREAPRYRGQRLKATGTCPLKELEYGATATVRIRYAMSTWGRVSGRATIEEPLPAGAFLIPGSVSSAGVPRHIEILPSKFIIHFGNWFGKGEISYRIGWRAPGTFRVPPTILSGRSSTQVRNSTTRLITLAQGEASTQPYVYNLIEHVELGRLHYRDGALAEAVAHLSQTLGKLRKSEGDVALMLVQILSRPEFEDSPMLIAAFEVLRQRHPDTTLGFPEIFAVGRAYAALGEEERAALVYRVLIAASFRNDCLVPDALQAQRFAREALALRDRFLRREYPDFGFISQRLDLAQQFESLAPLANESVRREKVLRRPVLPPVDAFFTGKRPNEAALLARAATDFERVLALAPADALADDAAFLLVNTFFDLKQYERALQICQNAEKLFPKSEFFDRFRYLGGVALFRLDRFDEAVKAAQAVAEGKSTDRDLARSILARILDAQGKTTEALKWYETISDRYPDAQRAIEEFTKSRLQIPKLTSIAPGAPVKLHITCRNTKDIELVVHRIDLERLARQSGRLQDMRHVRLEGIRPTLMLTVPVPNYEPYTGLTADVTLELPKEGAYTVTARSDSAYHAGLVLVTPLALSVTDFAERGELRATLRNRATGRPLSDATMLAIDERGRAVSGKSDLRGVFSAKGMNGRVAVLAQTEPNCYALHQGTTRFGSGAAPQRRSREMAFMADGIHKKLQEIIIPHIEFDEIPLREVVKILKLRSMELDPDGVGVNIYLQLAAVDARPDTYVPPADGDAWGGGDDPFGGGGGGEDPFGEDGGGEDPFAGGVGGGGSASNFARAVAEKTITMNMDNIPLGEVLRIVCMGAGLKMRIEANAVIIADKSVACDDMETRFYNLQAGVIDTQRTRSSGGDDDDDDDDDNGYLVDATAFFAQMGIHFPQGAKISYFARTGKLVVHNTSENLRKVEAILREINDGGNDNAQGAETAPSMPMQVQNATVQNFRGNVREDLKRIRKNTKRGKGSATSISLDALK